MITDSHGGGVLIDISHPLDPTTPPFPGDPAVEVDVRRFEIANARETRQSITAGTLRTSLHCGTHMDAPFHFYLDGRTIDAVPLDACTGAAVLLRLGTLPPRAAIDDAMLTPFAERLRTACRVVIDTGWHRRWRQEGYFTDHPVLTGAAARFLVSSGVRLVGVDTPSVDRPPYPAHLELLGSGVVILENLTNFAAIPQVEFELIALPLRLTGRDGSPVRAVARCMAPSRQPGSESMP